MALPPCSEGQGSWACLGGVGLTVWQKTTSRRCCRLRQAAMVGARSCMSRKTIAFLALSLIMTTQSVSVVSRGYRASLHSPAHREACLKRLKSETWNPTKVPIPDPHCPHLPLHLLPLPGPMLWSQMAPHSAWEDPASNLPAGNISANSNASLTPGH